MKNWFCALGFYAFAGCGTSGLVEQKSRTLVESSGFSGEGVDFEEDSIIGGEKIKLEWYFPRSGEPLGWVFLQHGFARSAKQMGFLARRLTEKGFAVVTPSLSVLLLQNKKFIEKMSEELLQKPLKPRGKTLPERFVMIGHSVGAKLVSLLGVGYVARKVSGFRGVVLLDAVGFGNEFTEILNKLKNVNVLALLAEPSACNSWNNVLPSLRQFQYDSVRNFVGLKLTGGSHCDAEGESSDLMCHLTCGASKKDNVKNLQDFVSHWATGFLNGLIDSNYLPGGILFEKLLQDKQMIKL
jgi:hypothetical protein